MAGKLKENKGIYEESEDLINIGAYKKGSNPGIDRAIELHPSINGFLRQETDERFTYEETGELLKEVIK